MTTVDINVANYIREQSEELQRLSKDARLDLLSHIFSMAAVEASKHELDMLPPDVPQLKDNRLKTSPADDRTILRRAALENALEGLVSAAVKRCELQARAAFYVAAETGLHRVAGMTKAYGSYTDGFKIGTQSLACGLAAAIRRPVITSDVTTDSSWADWRWLATAFDYRSCWSFPIEGRGGKVFGTFSMYFKTPLQASDQDIQFASLMTDAAAEIIGRHGAH